MINKSNKFLRNKKGFTLIELIVVIAVLGILAAVALPRIGDVTQKAKDNADKEQLRIFNEALERYIAESGDSDLSDIPDGGNELNAQEVLDFLKDEDGEYGPYLKANTTLGKPSDSNQNFTFNNDILEFE